LQQIRLADERCGAAGLAARVVVAERQRQNRSLLVDRGLEQGGTERQHL